MFVARGVDPLHFSHYQLFRQNVQDLEDSKSGSGAADPELGQSSKERSRN